MSTFPGTSPADAAGGFVVVRYNNTATGVIHRCRAHVQAFNGYVAGSGWSGAYVAGGSGTEADVVATAGAFMDQIKPQWASVWQFNLESVWAIVSGGPVEQFGWTPPAQRVGTSASGDSTIPGAYYMYTFRTTHGGKYRLVVLNPAGWVEMAPQNVAANAAGNASQQMVAYLCGAATRIVGHDGNPLVAPGRQIVGVNRRLRRKAGWA